MQILNTQKLTQPMFLKKCILPSPTRDIHIWHTNSSSKLIFLWKVKIFVINSNDCFILWKESYSHIKVYFCTGNDLFEGKDYFINIVSISIIHALPFSDQFIEWRYNFIYFSAAHQGTAVCHKNAFHDFFWQFTKWELSWIHFPIIALHTSAVLFGIMNYNILHVSGCLLNGYLVGINAEL